MFIIFLIVISSLQFKLIISASEWRLTLSMKFGVKNNFSLIGNDAFLVLWVKTEPQICKIK